MSGINAGSWYFKTTQILLAASGLEILWWILKHHPRYLSEIPLEIMLLLIQIIRRENGARFSIFNLFNCPCLKSPVSKYWNMVLEFIRILRWTSSCWRKLPETASQFWQTMCALRLSVRVVRCYGRLHRYIMVMLLNCYQIVFTKSHTIIQATYKTKGSSVCQLTSV